MKLGPKTWFYPAGGSDPLLEMLDAQLDRLTETAREVNKVIAEMGIILAKVDADGRRRS